MNPDRSAIILVLGVLSLVICAPVGIAAWVMGAGDLREIDAGLRVPEGRPTVKAGMICGIIGTILFIVLAGSQQRSLDRGHLPLSL